MLLSAPAAIRFRKPNAMSPVKMFSVPALRTVEVERDLDDRLARMRRASPIANLGSFTGYSVGYDLGAGNIGWTVLFLDGNGVPVFLTDKGISAHNDSLPRDACRIQLPRSKALPFVPMGTHKFQSRKTDKVSEAITEKPFPKIRAEARAHRRLLRARQAQLMHLRSVLRRAGLWPEDSKTNYRVVPANKLRRELLDRRGDRYDLGAAIYHLFKHRGWMKAISRDGEDTGSSFGRKATVAYREALRDFQCRTVGEFLHRCAADHLAKTGSPMRWRHRPIKDQRRDKKSHDVKSKDSFGRLQFLTPTVDLILEEAAALRAAQAPYFTVDDTAWDEIIQAGIYRRPLRAKIPGFCTYFSDEYRTVVALPSFQKFRIVEAIDNLRTHDGRRLTPEQRDRAFCLLDNIRDDDAGGDDDDKRGKTRGGGVAVATVARHIGVMSLKGEAAHGVIRVLPGNRTAARMRAVIGDRWDQLSLDDQDALVMRLLRRHPIEDNPRPWTSDDSDALRTDLQRWLADDALAEAVMDISFAEDHFANISLRAARTLTEAMESGVCCDDRWGVLGLPQPMQDIYTRLPYYGAVLPDVCVPADAFAPVERTVADEIEFGRSANHDLHLLLNRVRKVTNEIIEMMGGILPTRFTIEFARDALTADEKGEHFRAARKREKARSLIMEQIVKLLNDAGREVPRWTRMDRLIRRWQLAEGQGWRDYDGSEIPRSAIIDDSVGYQIDHVIPAAFGQRQRNNLFLSAFNRQKGAQTPWAAFSDDPVKAGAMLAFAAFGERLRADGIRWAIKKASEAKKPPSAKKLARLDESLKAAEKAKDDLRRMGEDIGVNLAAHPVTHALEQVDKGILSSSLLRAIGPLGEPVELDFAARDASNAGYGAKMARQYLECLGARCVAVKPWIVAALREMFNLDKDRKDLRNHAQDAFVIAHLDRDVLIPAFARINARPKAEGYTLWEDAITQKSLSRAMDSVKNGTRTYAQMVKNIALMKATLPFVATAHRRDTQWNPGDAMSGTIGAFGSENIYTMPLGGEYGGKYICRMKRSIAATAAPLPTPCGDDADRQEGQCADTSALNPRQKKRPAGAPSTIAEDSAVQRKYVRQRGDDKPGRLVAVDGSSKFCTVAPYGDKERQVIGVEELATMTEAERSALFAGGPVFRGQDTIIYDGQMFVIRGLCKNGQVRAYPIDRADADGLKQPRCSPTANRTPNFYMVEADVLGRRLHGYRTRAGHLPPVPYPVG